VPSAAFTSVAGTRSQLTGDGPAAAGGAVDVADCDVLDDPELPQPASRKAEAKARMIGRVICMGR
jgi:hypothetical protein